MPYFQNNGSGGADYAKGATQWPTAGHTIFATDAAYNAYLATLPANDLNALDESGWRLAQVNLTTGSENTIDLICTDYTAQDVDQIRFRITNISGGSGLTGRAGLVRFNTLTSNPALNSWTSTAISNNVETGTITTASLSPAWSQGAFTHACSTEYQVGCVEGLFQVMGSNRILGRITEDRIIRNSANTAFTFQKVDWSTWSTTIYTTKITSLRVLNWSLSSGALGAATNFNAGIRWEWYLKTLNA